MKITNKRANFEYKLENERFEAGIALSGAEVRAIKTGRADISQAHARIIHDEAFLINANIPVTGVKDHSPTRIRKLLLHKGEITSLLVKMKQGKLTLVPISMYTKNRLIKVGLALGKPKRKFEKRETIKRRDIEREMAQDLKNQNLQ